MNILSDYNTRLSYTRIQGAGRGPGFLSARPTSIAFGLGLLASRAIQD